MFFLVLISAVTLVGIVYLAVSSQSSFRLKIAALGALALMITTVIICLFLFFKSAGTHKQRLLPDMDPSDLPPVSTEHNLPMLIMLVIFLIALFIMVVIVSMREHKRSNDKRDKDTEDDRFFG
jgi:cytochrome bd-type quinol oxidase subunit 2